MSVLNNSIVPASAGDTGYTIDQSLRFNDDDSAYLSRTFSSGNRKTWTFSCWVKRGNLGGAEHQRIIDGATNGGGDVTQILFQTDNKLRVLNNTSTLNMDLITTQLFRDTSAWYHIVVAVDTTQGTASNRTKVYINGNQITDFDTETYPAQDTETHINRNVGHRIGNRIFGATTPLDGYLSEVHFINGQAKNQFDFGETGDYGEWKPIEYTGTYGTNGFYLDFADSADLGNDVSGEGNDWTPTNLASTDQMLDTPTNNFCTMNSASPNTQTLSEGGLKSTGNTNRSAVGTFPMISGKWYWEFYWTGGNNEVRIGLTDDASNGGYGGGIHAYSYTGNVANYLSGGNTNISCSPSMTQNSIIGFAWDADAGELKAFVNGTAINSGAALLTGFTGYTMMPHGGQGDGGFTIWYNFGQDSSFAGSKTAQSNTDDNGYGDFYYSPPTGFNALCTQNLDDPAVIPSEYFDVGLYTGTGANLSITDCPFQPDFVWIKDRSASRRHNLFDSNRGAALRLFSSDSDAEEAGGLTSFNSDGFTINGSYSDTNHSGENFVYWAWKANGSDVLNENGTIDSQVSANQDAGFSIVSYTGNGTNGATIGHGLSEAPEMWILKCRSSGPSWFVYHSGNTSAPETDYLNLNNTNATADSPYWNDTAPSNTVFTLGNSSNIWVNGSGQTYIAYCFHSVDGYSKVGSYTGNGSSDGTFVYTGFRPAFIMIKQTSVDDWGIYDSKRVNGFNNDGSAGNGLLYPNASYAEEAQASRAIDLLSNGFKLRTSNVTFNQNGGGDYIYLAFAETPFKYTNAR